MAEAKQPAQPHDPVQALVGAMGWGKIPAQRFLENHKDLQIPEEMKPREICAKVQETISKAGAAAEKMANRKPE